jgi:hypothetical protein
MNQVLLNTLNFYNIEYNITRLVSNLINKLTKTNLINSITRDNASSNDTLINSFKRYYLINGIKFEGNVACIAHVLNLVVQDILKAIIKNKDDYNALDNQDVFNIENEEEEDLNSKFLLIFIRNLLIDI